MLISIFINFIINLDKSKEVMKNQKELIQISNTCYSRANRHSYYEKQKEMFEKNIVNYNHGINRQENVHKHIREMSDMFKNLAPSSAIKNIKSAQTGISQNTRRAATCVTKNQTTITQRNKTKIKLRWIMIYWLC